MGDLVATCASPLSRNRVFGEHLGRGMTVAEAAVATSQTAEGVKSVESVLELAGRHGVEMPLTEVVVALVHGGVTPARARDVLMTRSPKPERYSLRRAREMRALAAIAGTRGTRADTPAGATAKAGDVLERSAATGGHRTSIDHAPVLRSNTSDSAPATGAR